MAFYLDASAAAKQRARAVLDALTLIGITAATFELGDEVDGIVTYDERLAAAARSTGWRS